jgi:hypothetical protein
MDQNQNRPTAKELAELAELTAFLSSREHQAEPKPGEPGFPTGLAGELLKLAENTVPEPAFATRLERQLHQAAQAGTGVSHPGWWLTLWQSFNLPERNTTMKRLITFALVGIALIIIMWVSIPSLFPTPTQTQLVLATPPTNTSAPTPLSPLTPTVVPPTAQSPVAMNFTPQPIPNHPPTLPSLVIALGSGYGGSGTGNLPQGMPINLATALPASPTEVNAYYRLENSPLTQEEASQIASQWGLNAQLYMPAWMESVSPDQVERSYIGVDGMQNLGMWNNELSFNDLVISPVYGGHQYPQTGLPPSDQAVSTATQYLTARGYLNYPYQVDLSQYNYGLVNFYLLMDNYPINYHVASVKVDPQGQVGSAWVSREEYQAVGSYPVITAEQAWGLLQSGQPSDQFSVSYYPTQDGNPQYWGRVYPTGQTAHLFGAPTYLLPTESGSAPYVEMNNLVLAGDVSGLFEYLQSNHGYIHAWGEVQEVNGTRQLQLAGWEPFDEFSGYFNGTVRRTADGDYLELSDGSLVRLPDLPADVPADTPLYAQGGLVDDTLEWFILQVHPSDEGQTPPDLSQAQAVIDKVELVYLAPGLSSMTPEIALDPSYRMLVPVWSFSGHITDSGGSDLVYRAYVQAAANP